MMASNEYNKNRRYSKDNYKYQKTKSPLNNKRRKSYQNKRNINFLKSKMFAKKIEKQKEDNYIPCSTDTDTNSNIINILNNCLNKDLFDDFSFNNNQKQLFNDNDIIKRFKSSKKKILKTQRDTKLEGIISPKSHKEQLKSFSSFESESFNLNKKDSFTKKKKSEAKRVYNRHFNKYKFHNNYGRRSVDLSHYNKKIKMHFKNHYKYNHNNDNSFISEDLKRFSFSRKDLVKECLMEDLDPKEISTIEENIVNDLNFINLRKRISRIKKTFIAKKTHRTEKDKSNENIIELHNVNEKSNINENEKSYDVLNDKSYYSNKSEKTISDISNKKLKFTKKSRALIRKMNLFDSLDEEDGFYEATIDIYISPNSNFIKIFDFLSFVSSLIYFIFIPYFLSKNYQITKVNYLSKCILYFIDFVYITEVIINSFRPYKSFDDNLIKSTKKIFYHYIKSTLLIDLLQAIPYFSLFNFLEKKNIFENHRIYILLMIKSIKILTLNDNSTKTYILELLSKIEVIDDNINTLEIIFIFISCLNITTCLYVFLGKNYYPSWIIKLNIQDESYINIYLTSLYFVVVTITTVGYGDITGNAIPEIVFQVILLILGTIAYSFIISYFSNYIVKLNQKSINFENKLNILKEIKYNHPNMEDSLYNEVLRNILNEDLFEKKDKQLLFQCLPYSLKNNLIMEMYKPTIKHFYFFKGVNNSDFVVKVVTSLRPLISVKGNILIHLGDFVKEIFFIKKGIIELCISIDMKDLDYSINNYFDLIENEKLNENYKSSFGKQKEKNKATVEFDADYYLLNNKEQSNYNDNSQIEDINVVEIKAREHLGESLMFLNKQSPFKARIGTRTAELLILKKMEAIEIYSVYTNIWKRINKKSLHNMEQIYLKIKKKLIELSNRYNIKLSKKNLSNPKIIKNNKQNNNSLSNIIKDKINNKMMKKKEKDRKKEIKDKTNNEINNTIKNIPQNITFKGTEEDLMKNRDSLRIEKSKKSIISLNINDANINCDEKLSNKNNKENNNNNLSENMIMSFYKGDNLNISGNSTNKEINKENLNIYNENSDKKCLRESIEEKNIIISVKNQITTDS